MFDQIVIEVDRARAAYTQSLRSIDSKLRSIVSQDPTQLAGAKAVQASYTDGIAGCDLAAAEHPDQTISEKPKAKAKRARKVGGTGKAKAKK